MAHFAKIEDGIVTYVVEVLDDVLGCDFPESEEVGLQFLEDIGLAGTWVQSSPTGDFRGRGASIGDLWDGTNFTSPA